MTFSPGGRLPASPISVRGGILSPSPEARCEGAPRLDLRTGDFDELALAFANWDAEFRQVSRGAFEGRLQVVPVGALRAIRVCANRVIRARGVQREGRFLFSLVTPRNTLCRWKSQCLRPGHIRVMSPREEMDHLSAERFEILLLSVSPAFLRETAEALHGIDVEDRLRGRFALAPAPDAPARLETYLRQLLASATSPRFLAHPGEARRIEQTAVGLLLECLLGGAPFSPGPDRRRNRRRLARGVEEYLEHHLREPLLARNLCIAFDVSQRTLEYAFREEFDVTPMAYWKTRRLNAVRQALKDADPAADTIHDIARHWGFWHTGAFAADYRRQFGELPRETLSGRRKEEG
jgi:AraC family ethanolamine operon transcriptional activator